MFKIYKNNKTSNNSINTSKENKKINFLKNSFIVFYVYYIC